MVELKNRIMNNYYYYERALDDNGRLKSMIGEYVDEDALPIFALIIPLRDNVSFSDSWETEWKNVYELSELPHYVDKHLIISNSFTLARY